MIRSGVAPLDERLGGVSPGRLHLLTGGPGTGKTTACLQFLEAGLSGGEAVGMLTFDRLTDLVTHARSIGFELEPAVQERRLLLLRFRPEFSRVLDSSGLPNRLIEDLDRLISEIGPTRLVIDSISPFLADGSASALAALVEFLDERGITTILTYPGDVSAAYERRLDPVLQRSAAIIHISRGDADIHRMQILQSRSSAAPPTAAYFLLRPGAGLVTLAGDHAPNASDRPVAKAPRKTARRSKAGQ